MQSSTLYCFSTFLAEVSASVSSESSTEEDIASSSFSAENVALKLLRNAKMKDEHLPLASELQWLVSEIEAPQTLLPLPKNWTSASESESEYSLKIDSAGKLDKTMRLRGTCDWAPPRYCKTARFSIFQNALFENYKLNQILLLGLRLFSQFIRIQSECGTSLLIYLRFRYG
jgi:hypothetical protein